MKILVVSSYLPFPLFSGGQVRLYNLIKELSRQHEITLVCEKRPFQTEKDIDEVKKICKDVITVPRKKQWSVGNILKAAFSTHSFLVTGHTTAEFRSNIKELLSRENFDLIHVETFYVMQNLPSSVFEEIPDQVRDDNNDTSRYDKHGIVTQSSIARNDRKKGIPVVLVEHNIEYHVYERFKNKAFILMRPFLAIDIAKIRHEEEHLWKKATSLVAVSEEDKKVMEKEGLHPTIVANGVNTDEFVYKEKLPSKLPSKKILFLGDFTWIQNKDSATFIIKEIWPLISSKVKMQSEKFDLKLWIVGRNIPDSIINLTKDEDVLFDQASSSKPTSALFQEAAILLAPIRVGGGTSYKILESMSSGTPVVTMQMSADAIGAKDAQDLMVGKDAQELADKSLQLLQDESLYKTISKNGRALVEKNYTWKEIGKKLDEEYEKIYKGKS